MHPATLHSFAAPADRRPILSPILVKLEDGSLQVNEISTWQENERFFRVETPRVFPYDRDGRYSAAYMLNGRRFYVRAEVWVNVDGTVGRPRGIVVPLSEDCRRAGGARPLGAAAAQRVVEAVAVALRLESRRGGVAAA